MIGIIDYGVGNLRSVQKALERVGAHAVILPTPQSVSDVDKLILPGVGAFADGMAKLHEGDWVEWIHAFIATGKPMLGICLGMQLLFESSTEDAPSDDQPVVGLGVLPGRVVRFDVEHATGDGHVQRIKVPHMGWNTLEWTREDPLLNGLEQGSAVYFVHSYYCVPTEDAATDPITSAVTEYPQGTPFTSTAHHENVWATQFHPEKSQRVGAAMLKNFASL